MMRSIGLKKHEVLISIMIELSIMGLIGLVIGLFSGNIMALGLTRIFSGQEAPFLIPWFDPSMVIFGISLPGGPGSILFYTVLTLGSAFVAAIIPGLSAAKIPPSEALRYTG
jgi:ABC-type lipoprotein release transport system permease subunit